MYNMTRDKKAAISMDIMAISIISIIVVVISIMVYFGIIQQNRINIENISEAEQCPENFTCTHHQCIDVVGASPMVANLDTPTGYVCCDQRCVCPEQADVVWIRGERHNCIEKSNCGEDEKEINIRTSSGMVCCCKNI